VDSDHVRTPGRHCTAHSVDARERKRVNFKMCMCRTQSLMRVASPAHWNGTGSKKTPFYQKGFLSLTQPTDGKNPT
jgi:hypothetical protein